MLMAADLAAMSLSAANEPVEPVRLEDVGRINDIAYDHPPQFARILESPPPAGTYATASAATASSRP